MLAEIPEAGRIMEIKGVGVVIAAGLLAEIGDIRRFNSPKQIQKLAGLAIVENSSGNACRISSPAASSSVWSSPGRCPYSQSC